MIKKRNIRILGITARKKVIYLYWNTKKPYWKRKPFLRVNADSYVVHDFLGYEIDPKEIYYKAGEFGKLKPLKEYEDWWAL